MKKNFLFLLGFFCVINSANAMVGAYDHREYVNWDDYPNIVQFRAPRGGICTAQYVGIDLILTAAHCVGDEDKYKITNNKGEFFYAYLETQGAYTGTGDLGKGEDWALLRIHDYRGFKLRNYYRWKVLKDDASVSNIGFGALRVLSTSEIKLLKSHIKNNPCLDNRGIRHCLKQYDDFMVENGYKKISTSDVKNLKADKNCYILVNTDCSKLCKTNNDNCITKCRGRAIPPKKPDLAMTCDMWGGNSGGPIIDKIENKIVSVTSFENGTKNFGEKSNNYTTSSRQFYDVVTNARKTSPTLEEIKSYNGKSCNESYLPKYAISGQYVVTDDNFYCYATACEEGKYLAVKKNAQDKWVSRGFCVTDKYCQGGKVLNILHGKYTDLKCATQPANVDVQTIVSQFFDNVMQKSESEVSEDTELKKSFISIDEPSEEIKTDEIDIKQLETMLKTLQANVDTGMKNISEQSDENILYILSGMVEYNALDELREKYEEAKKKEQSFENRALTALTVAATGIGGMELMQGLAEQSADKDADADMTAYIETMRCTYGDGKQVKAGPDEIELPGGNDEELIKLRNEYFALVADLKERKEALGMKPGIESEVIMDRTSTGLYDDENIGIKGGVYGSLYRAKTGNETDQAKINESKDISSKRVKGGGIAVGAGVVGGTVGNILINGKTSK